MAAPWLRDAWLRLVTAFESNQLAHAYYLKHCPDKGSNSFIEQFTKYLLASRKGKVLATSNRACCTPRETIRIPGYSMAQKPVASGSMRFVTYKKTL